MTLERGQVWRSFSSEYQIRLRSPYPGGMWRVNVSETRTAIVPEAWLVKYCEPVLVDGLPVVTEAP